MDDNDIVRELYTILREVRLLKKDLVKNEERIERKGERISDFEERIDLIGQHQDGDSSGR